MISLAKYRHVLASPCLGYLFAASIVGRLPIGMSGLSILLLVQGASGSFATGGAATGCFVAGLACVAPALGRIIDRYGPWAVLVTSAVLFPAWLIALVAAVSAGMSSLSIRAMRCIVSRRRLGAIAIWFAAACGFAGGVSVPAFPRAT